VIYEFGNKVAATEKPRSGSLFIEKSNPYYHPVQSLELGTVIKGLTLITKFSAFGKYAPTVYLFCVNELPPNQCGSRKFTLGTTKEGVGFGYFLYTGNRYAVNYCFQKLSELLAFCANL
jgi:hypothetical protein